MKEFRFLMRELAGKAGVLPPLKHYLLVRNPYDRLESFFRDKLRKHLSPGPTWQRSQRIFLPLLKTYPERPSEETYEEFLALSFEDFVRMLPQVYHKDPHIKPQYWVEYQGFRAWNIRTKYEEIYRMEDAKSLERMSEQFDLNLSTVRNSTKEMEVSIEWTELAREIVKDIYRKDFEWYGYDF